VSTASNELGITHLRHVDLAVPDFETQRRFYTDLWGLDEVGTDPLTQDQWGTADPMNELIARESSNDPDRGLFVAPPV
jgi:catechol 2,3-dioxygenase-like lactoylglutathione lyase family enzyme